MIGLLISPKFSFFTIRDSVSKTIIAPNVLVTGPLFSMVEDDFFGKHRRVLYEK